MNKEYHIYIDTNILIGAYRAKYSIKDRNALSWLASLKGKRLDTSSLSIAQLAAKLDKELTNEHIKNIIKQIQHRINILSFTNEDITKALILDDRDIEDSMQYIISAKANCLYFVTNNVKDYRNYATIMVVNSNNIRTIPK